MLIAVTLEPPQPQDQDIRQQLAAREYHQAFEQLLERYKEKVFRLCISMVRNETQAEDLTQDIFFRVWKALPGYHGAASPSTWIYSIARNCCLSYLRKQKTHPALSLAEEELERLEESVAVQNNVAPAGIDLDVQWMLGQLPEKYRQVVTLFYLEAKSYEEVGAMLGLPLGTVKTFLYRGKQELLKIAARSPQVVTRPNRITT